MVGKTKLSSGTFGSKCFVMTTSGIVGGTNCELVRLFRFSGVKQLLHYILHKLQL